MRHESCDGCMYDLGGGRDNCRLNLSYECRDGGGFEAWEHEEETTYKLNPEAQAVFDSIHVTVRMCRWFYECCLRDGFTSNAQMRDEQRYFF